MYFEQVCSITEHIATLCFVGIATIICAVKIRNNLMARRQFLPQNFRRFLAVVVSGIVKLSCATSTWKSDMYPLSDKHDVVFAEVSLSFCSLFTEISGRSAEDSGSMQSSRLSNTKKSTYCSPRRLSTMGELYNTSCLPTTNTCRGVFSQLSL